LKVLKSLCTRDGQHVSDAIRPLFVEFSEEFCSRFVLCGKAAHVSTFGTEAPDNVRGSPGKQQDQEGKKKDPASHSPRPTGGGEGGKLLWNNKFKKLSCSFNYWAAGIQIWASRASRIDSRRVVTVVLVVFQKTKRYYMSALRAARGYPQLDVVYGHRRDCR